MNFPSHTVADISLTKNVEKEKWINRGKNKQKAAISQSHDATSYCQFSYGKLTFYLKQLLINLLREITELIAWRERKVYKI